jgi:hypothetical protein
MMQEDAQIYIGQLLAAFAFGGAQTYRNYATKVPLVVVDASHQSQPLARGAVRVKLMNVNLVMGR